jgi:hypothetical protein
MKQVFATLLFVGTLNCGYPQGYVYFSNDTTTLNSPPDRLVRFDATAIAFNPFGTNNAPAVSNLVPTLRAQLYYGASTASENALMPVSTAPVGFKSSTSLNAGTWFSPGSVALDVNSTGVTVNMQVRVWDIAYASSYETTGGQGLQGRSQVFQYTYPAGPGIPPEFFTMYNFEGFQIGLVPEPSSVTLIALGFGILAVVRKKVI